MGGLARSIGGKVQLGYYALLVVDVHCFGNVVLKFSQEKKKNDFPGKWKEERKSREREKGD